MVNEIDWIWFGSFFCPAKYTMHFKCTTDGVLESQSNVPWTLGTQVTRQRSHSSYSVSPPPLALRETTNGNTYVHSNGCGHLIFLNISQCSEVWGAGWENLPNVSIQFFPELSDLSSDDCSQYWPGQKKKSYHWCAFGFVGDEKKVVYP